MSLCESSGKEETLQLPLLKQQSEIPSKLVRSEVHIVHTLYDPCWGRK